MTPTRDPDRYFAELQARLEPSYLAADEPWKQSGFSGPRERWVACRRPIADAIDASGTFLDIGCANGYLLESVLQWTAPRGVSVEPWGLDLSGKLVELARKRLPDWSDHLVAGNALWWNPPRRFDVVRTELVYVPPGYRVEYVRRLLEQFLTPEGKLLVAEYRSRKYEGQDPWVDADLEEMDISVACCHHGLWQGRELTRVAVVYQQ